MRPYRVVYLPDNSCNIPTEELKSDSYKTHPGRADKLARRAIYAREMHNNTFTIQYAREQITQEHWNSPIFSRVNQILTLTWGIAFALSALISWLLPLNVSTILHIVLVAIAIFMTIRFPAWYRNRALKNRSTEL